MYEYNKEKYKKLEKEYAMCIRGKRIIILCIVKGGKIITTRSFICRRHRRR